jgi:hypothetical protein
MAAVNRRLQKSNFSLTLVQIRGVLNMSFKENDEFAYFISELKKDVAREAELLSKIYGWFSKIATTNRSAAAKIGPQDLQKIGKLTSAEAEDIESRTKETGLSVLVNEHVVVNQKIIDSKNKLSELWPKVVKHLTNKPSGCVNTPR